jgi:hypothetical protein
VNDHYLVTGGPARTLCAEETAMVLPTIITTPADRGSDWIKT